jgi:hypothetical protein
MISACRDYCKGMNLRILSIPPKPEKVKTFIKVVFVIFFIFPASYLIALREGCEDGERARVSVIFLSSITLVVVDHPQHLHILKNKGTIWNVVFV